MSPKSIIVYRDELLPFSETFILNQARALERYRPIFTGAHRVSGLDLTAEDVRTVNRGGVTGRLGELAFGLGIVGPQLGQSLRSTGAQLLHAHFGSDTLRAMPLRRTLGVPMVATFHGYDVTAQAAGDGRYIGRLRRAARELSVLIAVSDFIAGKMVALGLPADRIRTHYIGVDTGRFTVAEPSRREPVVLAVGRLVEKKGFAYLIDAMAACRRAGTAARLVVIGGGPEEMALRAQAERERVPCEFLGPLAAEEVRGWLARARVVAVPSVTAIGGDTEGLPITLLEALASGTPVVATRHAGIPEVIADGTSGLLVEERDVRGLADGVRSLLERGELWSRVSAGGRERVQTAFELARQTRRLEEIYDDVLTSGGAG